MEKGCNELPVECPDKDAKRRSKIEIDFAVPVFVTHEQSQRLLEFLDEIVKAEWNQRPGVDHWLLGWGDKPQWSKMDALLLGRKAEPGAPFFGEPEFDEAVFYVETGAKSVDEEE